MSRRGWFRELRPEGPALYAMRCHQSLFCAAPSALIRLDTLLIHALTGVDIECRSFGPALLQVDVGEDRRMVRSRFNCPCYLHKVRKQRSVRASPHSSTLDTPVRNASEQCGRH